MALKDAITIPPKERNRETGIPAVGAVPWGMHLCSFYDTKQDLIDILVPYFKAGLENNEFCIWVTSEVLGVKEAEEAMTKAVPGFAQYLERGQIEIVPHSEWYLKGGTFNQQRVLSAWIDKLDCALANGYDGMRVTGDMAWLEKRLWKKFIAYEEEINNIVGKYHIIALCTYSLGKCGANEIIEVMRNHQSTFIRQAGEWVLAGSSQRKPSDEPLREFEEKYSRLFELSPVGITILDMNGVVTSCNPAVYQNGGYTEDELVGKHFTKIAPVRLRDIPKFLKTFSSIIRGKIPKPFEVEYNRKDGTTGWAEIHVSLLETGGRKLGVQILQRDITERKRAEGVLWESEQKYRSLFDNMLDGFAYCQILVDENNQPADFVYLEVNDAFEKLTGLSREDIIGKKVTEAIPGTKESHPELFSIYGKVALTGEETQFDIYFKPLAIWLNISVHSPRKGYFIAVFENITERKRAEEDSENMFNLSPDMVVVGTTEGGLIKVNPAWETILGYKTEELLKMGWTTLVHPDDVERTNREVEEQLKGSPVAKFVNRYKCKDGSYRTLEWQATFAKEGIIHATARDITERKGAVGKPLTPLQTKFASSGLESFDEREVMELLLSLCPGGMSEQVSVECLKVFQNIRGLLSATPQELRQAGCPAQLGFYLKLLHDIPAEVLREKIIEKPAYGSSLQIFDYLNYSIRDLKHEVFKVIYLDKRDHIIDAVDLFKGTLDSIPIRPREIVETAIQRNTAALIFVHNHPTGDPIASKTDKRLTRDLVFVGNVLQIRVLDHIIIGEDSYFSFADEGLIQKYEDEFLRMEIKRV